MESERTKWGTFHGVEVLVLDQHGDVGQLSCHNGLKENACLYISTNRATAKLNCTRSPTSFVLGRCMAKWLGNRISNCNSTTGEHKSQLSLFAPRAEEEGGRTLRTCARNMSSLIFSATASGTFFVCGGDKYVRHLCLVDRFVAYLVHLLMRPQGNDDVVSL
jgi:hypothetical protein